MTCGAAHQVGGELVIIAYLMHPWPLAEVGWDEGVIFLSIKLKKICAYILLGMEEILPPIEHMSDRSASCEVSRNYRLPPCLNTSRGCQEVGQLMVVNLHLVRDVVEVDHRVRQ